MSVFSLLYFLAYIVLFIIALIFLVILFPTNIAFQSSIDGIYYDSAVDFGLLLGLLNGSVNFGSEGGSFKLSVFSLPVYRASWTEEEKESEEPEDAKPSKRRKMRKLIEPSKRLFNSVTRMIKVHKLDIFVKAGLSDPYISGLIFGFVYPVVEMLKIFFSPLQFYLTPVFVEERFKSDMVGSFSFRIILMVFPLLRFFISREFREYRRS